MWGIPRSSSAIPRSRAASRASASPARPSAGRGTRRNRRRRGRTRRPRPRADDPAGPLAGDAEHAEALVAQFVGTRVRRSRAARRACGARPAVLVVAHSATMSSGAPLTTSRRRRRRSRAAPRRAGARSRTAPRRSCVQPRQSMCAVREDRVVERALQPGLEGAVEVGELEHALAVAPERDRRGARAGCGASVSVPVLSVQSTSMLPRSWIAGSRFTTTRLPRHAQRAVRKRHRHDHRQQLGREADRERDREQERFEPAAGRAATLTSSTNSTSSSVRRMISRPKRRVPSSNAVGGGGFASAPAMRADRGRVAGARNQHARGAADHGGAHEDGARRRVGVLRVAASRRHASRPGRARRSDSAWLHEEVARLEHAPVGRDQVTGGEQHHVPRHHLGDRNVELARRRGPRVRAPRPIARRRSATRRARRSCTKSSVTERSTSVITMNAPIGSPVAASTAARGEQHQHQRVAEVREVARARAAARGRSTNRFGP